ncbi:MAG: helix-turn-helix domain-containing protein [Helicobacteraceae bacterium]
MRVSERIKFFRKEKNWRQEDLAKFSGVSLPSIKRYELGQSNITVKNLRKISDALGVDLSDTTPELEKLRVERGLSRERVAKLANINIKTLTAYENGAGKKINIRDKILEVLNNEVGENESENSEQPTFSKRLREFRTEKGWTQAELAKFSGVSIETIKRYENDKTNPTAGVEKIAAALNINIGNLYDESHVAPSAPITKQIQDDQMYIIQLSRAVGAGKSVAIDGVDICDTDVLIPFSKMLFKTRLKSTENLRCMRVDGYSMVPLLYPDSWVIADVRASFDGDGLYIINYCGNFMVKLLQKSPDGTLHIKSVNKDYESFTVRAGDDTDVYIVGRVLRCVV